MTDVTPSELVRKQRAILIIWDWKEQVPVDEVSAAAQRGFIFMYTVDDTFGDYHAIVACQIELAPNEVQPLFELLEEVEV